MNEDPKGKENLTPASGEEKPNQDPSPVGDKDPTLENVDYKAELERLKGQLGQAEHVIETLKGKKKLELEFEDPPIIDEAAIEQIVERKLAGVTKNLQLSAVRDLALKRSSSPEEADLILFHYQHSIIPSGNITEDIENAWTLANKKRLVTDASEAKRSLAAHDNRYPSGSGGGQKPPVVNQPVLTPQQQELARIYNIPPEKLVKPQ